MRNGVSQMPRKRPELNVREKAILRYIEKQIMNVGYPPSVREIGKAVDLSSTATVHGYLAKLDDVIFISSPSIFILPYSILLSNLLYILN